MPKIYYQISKNIYSCNKITTFKLPLLSSKPFCLKKKKVVSSVTSKQEGRGFESTNLPGPSCVRFAYSPCHCQGSLWVFWLPITMLEQLENRWKLAIVMNMSINGFPYLSPYDTWSMLQNHPDPEHSISRVFSKYFWMFHKLSTYSCALPTIT